MSLIALISYGQEQHINEEAWIAPYYAGDCMLMMESNENLAFYLPLEISRSVEKLFMEMRNK